MLVRLINQAEEAFLSLLLVSMTLLVFADVVMRFGFNTGLMWSEELTLLMSAWFVLFGV
ncbi:MAG: TRAP transporter small permease, partial [Gammaproteobacteria bacterium]|nr:TRAP transporter small permease [Gammaproteobacteria bacterium]